MNPGTPSYPPLPLQARQWHSLAKLRDSLRASQESRSVDRVDVFLTWSWRNTASIDQVSYLRTLVSVGRQATVHLHLPRSRLAGPDYVPSWQNPESVRSSLLVIRRHRLSSTRRWELHVLASEARSLVLTSLVLGSSQLITRRLVYVLVITSRSSTRTSGRSTTRARVRGKSLNGCYGMMNVQP